MRAFGVHELGIWREGKDTLGGDLIIRRIGPNDGPLLTQLALDDRAFDLDRELATLVPLGASETSDYLSDPSLLNWVALEGELPLGFLCCHILKMRAQPFREVLIYEIGVRLSHRRQGIGRRLLAELRAWMTTHSVSHAWVLSEDSDASAFYRACGFTSRDDVRYLVLGP